MNDGSEWMDQDKWMDQGESGFSINGWIRVNRDI